MAIANPYKQGETTYQDTLIQNAPNIPGSTIPTGAGLTGATAGAPVVQPKTVVPATKVATPTPLEVQKQTYQAQQPVNVPAAQPTQTVLPDALDAQKLEYQAMQKQAVDQQLAKTPAEQQAQDLAVQQQQAKDAAAASAVQSGAATTGATPTTSATSTVAPATTETTQETMQENPYQKQLENMKFDYNPQSDPEYMENASALENQVSQMMVGRGGLYSSVAASAYQSRLASLQNDFRKQKYEQFVQDRNFTLSMAKQWFDEQATIWNQKQTEKEFDFAKEKEAFDQKMALAAYNLQVQAQAFAQSQARAAARQREADAKAAYEAKIAEQELQNRTMVVQGNATIAKAERDKYNRLLTQWKTTGTASSEVASYFNVPYGGNISKYSGRIAGKNTYIGAIESTIISNAYELGLDKTYYDMITSSISPNYLVAPVATTPARTETVQYDSLGNPTGKSVSTRYGSGE